MSTMKVHDTYIICEKLLCTTFISEYLDSIHSDVQNPEPYWGRVSKVLFFHIIVRLRKCCMPSNEISLYSFAVVADNTLKAHMRTNRPTGEEAYLVKSFVLDATRHT